MNVLSGRYHMVTDGRQVATWDRSPRRVGGTLEVDGRRYVVRADPWGTTCSMLGEAGDRIASADRLGRRDWTIKADGTTYQFRRASPWRQREVLRVDGRRAGSIRRSSPWRADAVADLPGLPEAVELFALAVALLRWDVRSELENRGLTV